MEIFMSEYYRFYVAEHPDFKDAWAVYGKPATGEDVLVNVASRREEAVALANGRQTMSVLKFSTSVRAFVAAASEYFTMGPDLHYNRMIDVSLELERLVYSKGLRWDKTVSRDAALKISGRMIQESTSGFNGRRIVSVDETAQAILSYASAPGVVPDTVAPFIKEAVAEGRFAPQSAPFLQNFYDLISYEAEKQFGRSDLFADDSEMIMGEFFRETAWIDHFAPAEMQTHASQFVAWRGKKLAAAVKENAASESHMKI
jgi:hypothetical protein